jgi:predicted regulator of Ras-like GTPase activity (Roadblock/LC7/MglB family)
MTEMTMQQDQDWMIGDVAAVAGVRYVVVLSADGLPKAASKNVGKETADTVSAACAGLQALGQTFGKQFGQPPHGVRQLMVEFDGGFLFVRTAGAGSHLAVITGPVVDPGLIAQQMQQQIIRLGEHNLATPLRGDHPQQ